jgi:hypothetical protein
LRASQAPSAIKSTLPDLLEIEFIKFLAFLYAQSLDFYLFATGEQKE